MCCFLGEKYLEGPTSTGVHHPIMRPLSVPSESFCSSSFSFTSKNLSQGTPLHSKGPRLALNSASFQPISMPHITKDLKTFSLHPNITLFVFIISPGNTLFPTFNHKPTQCHSNQPISIFLPLVVCLKSNSAFSTLTMDKKYTNQHIVYQYFFLSSGFLLFININSASIYDCQFFQKTIHLLVW